MSKETKLPNIDQALIDQALIDERKITKYLLSAPHSSGRTKAQFFNRFGFHQNSWRVLEVALLRHAKDNPCAEVKQSEFGEKYIINGEIVTPDGRNPAITSVWFLEQDDTRPRFVTAYPMKGKRND